MEGFCLSKNNNRLRFIKEIADAAVLNGAESKEISESQNLLYSEQWGAKIGAFLDQHRWCDHAITFLLPAEDVTFRKLTFPFRERKKVEQALPFELEEELPMDLRETVYSVDVHPLSGQTAPDVPDSEALVLLMGRERLEQLQQLCLERDLLIRNVDCSAYALYRSMFNEQSSSANACVFQIYLGGDEAFVNTVRDGRLHEIKIFPNRIPEILYRHLISTEKSGDETSMLTEFLYAFAKHPDGVDRAGGGLGEPYAAHENFIQIKEELRWLCAQFTRYLRMQNFTSESQIIIYGIFAPMMEWDGVVFRIRVFPLPEAEAFAERGREAEIGETDLDTVETWPEKNEPFDEETNLTGPDTLEALMQEAKEREKTKPETPNDENDNETQSLKNPPVLRQTSRTGHSGGGLTSVNPQATLLSLSGRNYWGVLGEFGRQTEFLLDSHRLSLYYESTPWRKFLRRNRNSVVIAAILTFIVFGCFAVQIWQQMKLLRQEIAGNEQLIQSELQRALPKTSVAGVKAMLAELEDKIRQREAKIEISKNFEKRDYRNLRFLKNISALLDEGAPFQVDSLEYAPERFSFSGTIDSYDRLQLLKNRLRALKEFAGKRIVESNRKSPQGIVYRISIDLK